MAQPANRSVPVVEFRPDLDHIYRGLYQQARVAAFTIDPSNPAELRRFFDVTAPLLRDMPNGLVMGMSALVDRQIDLLIGIKKNPPINVITPEGEAVDSITKLADAIDISATYLYDFRNRSAVPCIKIMGRIAWAFGLEWLMWNFQESVTRID